MYESHFLGKHLFSPDRTLMTDKKGISLSSLLGLPIGVGVKGLHTRA